MLRFLIAIDYSRPVQRLFGLPPRAGTIHSVFRRAANIAIDDTILALLSSELPRTPTDVRLPSALTRELLQELRPGMEVWIGDERLLIPACMFTLHLPSVSIWEPRPAIMQHRWGRKTIAQYARQLAHYLADWPQQHGLAPLIEPLLLG